MAKDSKINWTQATWNPWSGCHKVSAGCKHCYMFRDKARFGQDPNVVVRSKTTFADPLRWKEPRIIFTCSWSDWFIEEADAWRTEAWEIIRHTPQHTYQILTKRPERFAECMPPDWGAGYPNVWLGVSVENQDAWYERAPHLRIVPAAVRWLSCEPLLGPIEFEEFRSTVLSVPNVRVDGLFGISWVVTGGESGPGARPMDPAWALSIRDQCAAAGVAFHHKQNGGTSKVGGEWGGRELDGKIYDASPNVSVSPWIDVQGYQRTPFTK